MQGLGPGALSASSQPHPSDYDPNNTTLFIGGLSSGARKLASQAAWPGTVVRLVTAGCCGGALQAWPGVQV